MWPAGSGHCWYSRDSSGQRQGPGDNVFSSANVAVDAGTGNLVVRVAQGPADGAFTCGEVFLDRSLGHGDYVFVVQTDPSLMHPNLVASPFLYAENAPDGSSRELDVVEFARWGQPSIPNSQFVVQPWTSNPPHVFNVSGVGHTHRMRWSGSGSPQQVQFEAYAADGALMRSWTNTGEASGLPAAGGGGARCFGCLSRNSLATAVGQLTVLDQYTAEGGVFLGYAKAAQWLESQLQL
ncbi:hypothetical protein COO60DRAFT_1075566 [Scenedesmus sp. NREL 46B-D3]|nr:hypothetical protein COO60DRAFT_1075566 [Scenedesmus sp. NREL 46B-D3]